MDSKIINICKQLEERQLQIVELYKFRFKELWSNFKDLNLGRLNGSFEISDKGYLKSGSFDLPNIHRLKGLYPDFRHFFQPGRGQYVELATFSALLKNHFPESTHSFLNTFSDPWNNSLADEFESSGNSYSGKDLIDLFFYGELLYSDLDKIESLSILSENMKSETLGSLIFMAIYDGIITIKNLHWSIQDLCSSNQTIKIPNA